jgi:hypothetical protein
MDYETPLTLLLLRMAACSVAKIPASATIPKNLTGSVIKKHYGFPWIMGGDVNPQQFPGYNPENDVMLNKNRYGYEQGFFHDDPTFPPMPAGLVVTPGVNNYGPHADYFRDSITGIVMQAGDLGIAMNSFTPHRSPLGLVFDHDGALTEEFKYDGFMTSYQVQGDSAGDTPNGGTGTILDPGQDVVHLQLTKNGASNNYNLTATRIAEGFIKPVDACIKGNIIYLLEYAKTNNTVGIWKVTLPADTLEIETAPLTDNSLCLAEQFSVSFTSSGVFNSGNIFTAQLSNASGNFSSPVAIGTLTATSSGTITATVPSGTSTGTKYRVRVVSSSPTVTGTNNGQNISISCPAPVGLSTTAVKATSAKVNWALVSCAEGYQLKYRVAGGSWTNVNLNASASTKKLNNLLPSTEYEWKIRTKCVSNPKVYSAYSAVQHFTTKALKEGSEEGAPPAAALSAFPNPFSDEATIRIAVSENSDAELALYDMQGKTGENNCQQRFFQKELMM